MRAFALALLKHGLWMGLIAPLALEAGNMGQANKRSQEVDYDHTH